MMVRVKICGIGDAAAMDAAVEAGADWIGFVFFPPSPRFVQPAEAAALAARSPGGPTRGGPARGGPARVGLFVEPRDEDVAAVLAEVPLDALQVYAASDRVSALGARFGLPVWRALAVASRDDLPGASGGANRFVLEASPPPQATRPGGNATQFDWALLRGWQAPCAWTLAGGLTPANVAAAVRATKARAVDVSSGVESRRGVKDPALIRAFVAAARTAAR